MTRRMMIAGNWKLHTSLDEALGLARQVWDAVADVADRDLVVAPPYPYLHAVASALADSNVAVGAQELFHEDVGAWTGAVSAPMLESVGCRYVLVGHSERRQHFGESDESANKRVHAALRTRLIPILCVGETLSQRENGETESVVVAQARRGLEGVPVESQARMIIAYEPVWAIGTGKVASPAQAQAVHAAIRAELPSSETRILYGGSVKPGNAGELFSQPDIDGGLVGGASLKAEDFASIAKA
ncbi:MAG: triose-phosphate isomerase [Myxococcota bacterium]